MVYNRYILAIAGSAFLLALVIPARQSGLTPPVVAESSVISEIRLPTRLIIPKTGVNAVVEQIGLTPEGAMDVPKGPDAVAWFDQGPLPGEVGSAVIDGHSGWKNNIPAVFDTLNTLRKGDKIYVIDAAGITTNFVVREIRTYDPTADANDVFYSNNGKAHLNLITCEGVWDANLKSYSDRLVVFADKE